MHQLTQSSCYIRLVALLLWLSMAVANLTAQGAARPVSQSDVIIPALANASRPADLDFTAGECDLDEAGKTMDCVFQQVFLTLSPLDKATCLVTTNRYARTFQRESATRWISREGPAGACGVLDIATLDDGGATRWTMELREEVTAKDARCAAPAAPEILSWQNVIRPLPCTRIQPGAMSR